MLITSIEKDNKTKGQYFVYIDNSFAFSVPEEYYLKLNLYEKKEIDEQEIKKIRDTVVYEEAKARAIKFLSLRLKTEKELRDMLKQHRYDRETVDKVVDELRSYGYINDRLYIHKYIYDRCRLKPKSKKLLKYELLKKGLPAEIIDEVLSDFNVDEYSIAENLVRKKFGKYDLNDKEIIKKAYNFLKHRGFENTVIEEVFKKLDITGF